jgi:hypothetical protein
MSRGADVRLQLFENFADFLAPASSTRVLCPILGLDRRFQLPCLDESSPQRGCIFHPTKEKTLNVDATRTGCYHVMVGRLSSVLVSSLTVAKVSCFLVIFEARPKAAPCSGSSESCPTKVPLWVNSISSQGGVESRAIAARPTETAMALGGPTTDRGHSAVGLTSITEKGCRSCVCGSASEPSCSRP